MTIYCAKVGCHADVTKADSAFCPAHRPDVPLIGRPKCDKPRTNRVRINLTNEEYSRLIQAAMVEGVDVPMFIRLRLADTIHPDTAEASPSRSEADSSQLP